MKINPDLLENMPWRPAGNSSRQTHLVAAQIPHWLRNWYQTSPRTPKSWSETPAVCAQKDAWQKTKEGKGSSPSSVCLTTLKTDIYSIRTHILCLQIHNIDADSSKRDLYSRRTYIASLQRKCAKPPWVQNNTRYFDICLCTVRPDLAWANP